MRGLRGFVGLVSVAALLAACEPKESAQDEAAEMAADAAAARTAIEAANAAMAAHINAEHWDSAAMVYADNGRSMPPNMPVDLGREAITKSLAAMAGMKVNISFATTSVAAHGDIAIESGTYSFTFTPPGAPGPMTDTGKYLAHWHKIGDKWVIAENIWNSDLPAQPMGPPAAKP